MTTKLHKCSLPVFKKKKKISLSALLGGNIPLKFLSTK